MKAKQLSVFIENRQGRLGEVLSVLKDNNINILSLSLADTADYGLLRLIVNDPVKGKEVLLNKGFNTMVTDVLVIKITHTAGSLQQLLGMLSEQNINVEYMYGLSIDGSNAFVVLKASNLDMACQLLKDKGVETLSSEQIKNIK